MAFNRALFSSFSPHWATPAELYKELDAEFGFDFDPCPLKGKVDGLTCKWGKRNFVNPPYGPEIAKWLTRAIFQRERERVLSVFLLPARTDTKWFHELVLPHAANIRFIRGRLKFGGSKNSAPFPSMVVVFR